jgi:hypothetical protein
MKTFRSRVAALGLACVLFSHALILGVSVIPQEGTHLTVTAATPTIRQFDPLILVVVLENHTADPLILDRPFSDAALGFQLEMRRKGDVNYAPVGTPLRGCVCGELASRPILHTSGKLVSYEVLSWWKQAPVFAEPGAYELQATVRLADGRTLTSQPVTVEVTPTPAAERRVLEELGLIPHDPANTTNDSGSQGPTFFLRS